MSKVSSRLTSTDPPRSMHSNESTRFVDGAGLGPNIRNCRVWNARRVPLIDLSGLSLCGPTCDGAAPETLDGRTAHGHP